MNADQHARAEKLHTERSCLQAIVGAMEQQLHGSERALATARRDAHTKVLFHSCLLIILNILITLGLLN
jgi:hypothetical protein